MKALIYKEAYRAGQLAAWFAVAAVALVLVETVIALITGTLTEVGLFFTLVAAPLTSTVFGAGAFQDDVRARALTKTATLPFSRRTMWLAKVGTWGAIALLLSAWMLGLRGVLPVVMRGVGGINVETEVLAGGHSHMPVAYALACVGLFYVSVWAGQFAANQVSGCSPGCMAMSGFMFLLVGSAIVTTAQMMLDVGGHSAELGALWTVLAAIYLVASLPASYISWVSFPPLEVWERTRYSGLVFVGVIGGLSLGAIALASLR
ncbi:MAG TPA: hypothetical protein DGT21_20495 [Armatimonadetes bacterium]|nr:hypothetical protein [Armatimonadota bacterium]